MSSEYFTIKTHVVPGQYIRQYPGATLDSQEDVLQLHVKQYTPIDHDTTRVKGITVVGAHANGFPKELYEPLWDEVYLQAKGSEVSIGSIWIADVASQGASGVLNEDKLGNDPSWHDHPRDLLYMINHFRDQMPRPLVGIGHSMGGSHLVNLSTLHPRLLTTLVLIDPVFQLSPVAPAKAGAANYARLSTFRRDIWPSRSVATKSFAKSPYYKEWDPRVLALWNQHALRELPTTIYPDPSTREADSMRRHEGENQLPDPPVTLTTTKHQEVFTFLRPNFPTPGQPVINHITHPDLDPAIPAEYTYPFYRPESASTFRLLPDLRSSVLYIFGGSSEVSPPQWCEEKLESTGIGVGGSGGVKMGMVKSVTLQGIGHLIPMIVPKVCAQRALEWLAPELQRWRDEDERWTREWQAAGRRDRRILSEAYKEMIGGNPRVKSRSEKL